MPVEITIADAGGVSLLYRFPLKNRTDQVTFFAEGTVPSFGRGIGKTHEMVSKLAGVPERELREKQVERTKPYLQAEIIRKHGKIRMILQDSLINQQLQMMERP